MSDFGDNIRRISRYDQLLKLVREAQATADQAEKLAIQAKKSTTYKYGSNLGTSNRTGGGSLGGGNNTQTSGQPGGSDTNATDTTSSTKDGTAQAINPENPLNGANDLGSASDLTSLDNTGRDGWYDAKSLLDNAADSYGKQPPISSDGSAASNNQYTGDTVNSLTGLTNAGATRNMIVHLIDAALGMVGPDGWANLKDAGPDPTYTAGEVWAIISGGTVYFGNTFDAMVAERSAVDGTYCYAYSGALVTSLTPAVGDNLLFSGNFAGVVGSTVASLGGTQYTQDVTSPTIAVGAGHYKQQNCGVSAGDTTACTTSPPTVGSWGDLGVTQIGWITPFIGGIHPYFYEYIGRFMPNPFDTVSVPTEYQNGASILDMKTTDGTTVRLGPLKEGGWYYYQRDAGAGNAPAGSATANSVLIMRANRTVEGFITPNELTKRLP